MRQDGAGPTDKVGGRAGPRAKAGMAMRGRLTIALLLAALFLAVGAGAASAAGSGFARDTGAVLFRGGDVGTLLDRDAALVVLLALIAPGMIALGVAATRQPRRE